MHQRLHVGHHGVQVERPGLQHLPPAEREQLLRQLCGAVGRPDDLAEVAPELAVAVRALQEQRRVAGDPGEQVVEVVGDAAGQPAEALELLRAQELRLEPLALGDVAEEGDVQPREEVGAGRGLGDSDGPIAPLRLPLGEDRAAGNELGPVRLDRVALVRRQELLDLPADQVALGDAQVLAAGGIDVDVAALVVCDEDRIERRVEDGAQLLLVLAQHGLGAFAANRRREQARRRPECIELGRAPGSLRHAVVEADEAPPGAVDEDRDRRDREDVLRVENASLLGGEVAHLAGEELVALPDPGETRKPDFVEAHVLHQRVVELRCDSVGDPFEALARDPLAVGPHAALEQVGAARLGCDPEPSRAGRPRHPARSARRRAGRLRG